MMLTRLRLAVAVGLAVCLLAGTTRAQAPQARKKVLFLTHAGLYKHTSLQPAEEAVAEWGKTSGFDVTALQVLLGALGAVVGLGVGSVVHRTRLVFPESAREVSVEPLLTRRGAGVSLTRRW